MKFSTASGQGFHNFPQHPEATPFSALRKKFDDLLKKIQFGWQASHYCAAT